MDEGLVALLQIVALLVFAGFCIRMAMRKMWKKTPEQRFHGQMKKLSEDKELVAQRMKEATERVNAMYPPDTTLAFAANYTVYTSLEALNQDGQQWALDSKTAPPDVWGGRWGLGGASRWNDLEVEEEEQPAYKRFLVVLRKAVEAEGTPAKKLARMKDLNNQPDYAGWFAKVKEHYAYKSEAFPENVLWEFFARIFECSIPQAASLLDAGYETLESVANAQVDAIKKLPKFGPKSAPVTINTARRKLDLPPLPL